MKGERTAFMNEKKLLSIYTTHAPKWRIWGVCGIIDQIPRIVTELST